MSQLPALFDQGASVSEPGAVRAGRVFLPKAKLCSTNVECCILTKEEFLARAKGLHSLTQSHSRLCAEYINQYWYERDGRFAKARVWLFDENDEGWHIIISDMKNGYPPERILDDNQEA